VNPRMLQLRALFLVTVLEKSLVSTSSRMLQKSYAIRWNAGSGFPSAD
jgi:hypothetical protein